ncbi:hypothetical protein AB835_12895 [Candidatus Endobugula sertula]|uniref:HTH-type transcriptional repressor AllR n=1 Tax=Candidatus Endobugula sertula TaxID=62101 RepID=A0A1D2QM99_9GAMM|nr:hypothetical protein AB835_12895 [Candidatus Endobugula sertula]
MTLTDTCITESARRDSLLVESVVKAFKVIEAFDGSRADLSLTDISERTGLNKSAAQRFVHTLQKLNYLEKDPASRRYTLTIRILEQSNHFLSLNPLVNHALPHIIELRRQLNCRVGMGCLYNTKAMYLVPLQSNRTAFKTANAGLTVPLFCTSSGRVLLAHQDIEIAKSLIKNSHLKKYTPFTVIDTHLIEKAIEKVKQQGYCITEQEFRMGDINTSAPVFNKYGEICAAVTVAGPNSEWTHDYVSTKIAPLVIETARGISLHLT